MVSKGQNSTFSEHGHIAYQIYENHECSNVIANILNADTPYTPDPVDGVSRSKFTFSEHGHVTNQIKENQECTNMVTNIFRTDPPNPLTVLWIGSVGHNSIFSEHSHVIYQIKENQECTNMVANISLADPLPLPPP